jgi:hypothetical protein
MPLIKPHIKPGRWNIQGGLVPTEWQWIWDRHDLLSPVLEGGGTLVRNYGRTRLGADIVGGGTWVTAPWGAGVFTTAVGEYVSWPDASVPDYVTNQLPFTVCLLASKGSDAQTLNARLLSRTENDDAPEHHWQIIASADSNDRVGFSIRRNGTQTELIDDGTNMGLDSVAFIVGTVSAWSTDTPTMRLWVNGTEYTDTIGPGIGNGDLNTLMFARRRASGGNEFDGSLGWLGVFPFAFNTSQALQISNDYLGPFRMAHRRGVRAAAIAA